MHTSCVGHFTLESIYIFISAPFVSIASLIVVFCVCVDDSCAVIWTAALMDLIGVREGGDWSAGEQYGGRVC